MVLLVCVSLVNVTHAQGLLQEMWKLKLGDDPAWSSVSCDDAAWAFAKAGTLWEDQGFGAYDGFAWYRTSVVLPSQLKAKADRYGGFLLRLAKIDDADETFFNGTKIGATGKMPPQYEGAWDADREYAIPPELIRWDQTNVIAVRVYDAGGGGGIYGEAPELTLRGLADLVTIDIRLGSPNHVFLEPENVVVPVEVSNGGDEMLEGTVKVVLESDFHQPVFEQATRIKVKAHGEGRAQLVVPHLEPGFYLGSAEFESLLNAKTHHFGLAVEPEKVIVPPRPPADFKDYWRRAKQELAAVAPQYKVTRVDDLCTATRDLYLVEMRSLGNLLIRGWYATPVAPGTYPAILHVQGYSSTVEPSWLDDGDDFVSFGLNIRGHGNSQDNLSPGFPGYLLEQLHDKEMYIYRGAYMDCVRAVDFLCSRPEVDKRRIVVEGASQGGALSIATAALDNERIWLCIPQVPFLSDFHDYFKVAAWPASEYAAWVEEHPEVGWDGVYETLSYIDIRNLAPWVKAPVLMASGLLDNVCPPHINFAAFNNLTVPREYRIYPYSGHGLPQEFQAEKMAWIRMYLAAAAKQ